MKLIKNLLLIVVASFVLNAQAENQCEPTMMSPEGMLWTYGGHIDKYEISMIFDIKHTGAVEARYAYRTSTKDIKLFGTLMHGKIHLDEKDDKGQTVATFDGVFDTKSPNGDCTKASGEWHDLRSGKILPFTLHGFSGQGGSLDHMYEADNDEIINKAAVRLQNAVKNNDKSAVAKLVSYPADLYISPCGGKPAKIFKKLKNEKALIKNYDLIFTARTKKEILDDFPRFMFARNGAVGGVGVWWGTDGKIITLPIVVPNCPGDSKSQ